MNIAFASEIFLTKEVQVIVKRIITGMVYKYEDKNVRQDKDDLYQVAYEQCVTDILPKFRYQELITTLEELPQPLLAHIHTNLVHDMIDYIHKHYGIKRTTKGYKSTKSIEFDPAYHGGTENKLESTIVMNDWVDEAIFWLKDIDFDLLVLEYFEDRTPKEMAMILDVEPSTYRKRKHKALKRLQANLEAHS